MTDTERLAFTQGEASASLGVSLRHFQRHVLPQLRIVYCGGRRLIPRRELERWIEQNARTVR